MMEKLIHPQINSVRLRFCMLNLRMHRFFKRNENMTKVKCYINDCSRGDWFVLYQLSKNLNRPFFMDFLVTLARWEDFQRDGQRSNRAKTCGLIFDFVFLMLSMFDLWHPCRPAEECAHEFHVAYVFFNLNLHTEIFPPSGGFIEFDLEERNFVHNKYVLFKRKHSTHLNQIFLVLFTTDACCA